MHDDNNDPDEARQYSHEIDPDGLFPLNPDELDLIARSNADVDIDLLEMQVWPVWRDEAGLRVAGWCPACGLPHVHGLGETAARVAHCSGPVAAPRYRLEIKPESAPLDLQRGLESDPPDLGTMAEVVEPLPYGARMLGLDAAQVPFRRRRPVSPAQFRIAADALERSGIFDERAALRAGDGGDHGAAMRGVIAQFVRRQPGTTMRARLAKAMRTARVMVAKGEEF